MTRIAVLSMFVVACLAGGVLFAHLTYRYALASEMDSSTPAVALIASNADAGPPLATTVTITSSTQPEPTAASPAVIDQVVRDVQRGNWRYAMAGALSLLMLALQRARGKVRWFAGRRGGAILVMVLALAGSLVTVLASSTPLTPGLLFGAFTVALTAVGGWEWVRALLDRSSTVVIIETSQPTKDDLATLRGVP
jgi:hypothetical protein